MGPGTGLTAEGAQAGAFGGTSMTNGAGYEGTAFAGNGPAYSTLGSPAGTGPSVAEVAASQWGAMQAEAAAQSSES